MKFKKECAVNILIRNCVGPCFFVDGKSIVYLVAEIEEIVYNCSSRGRFLLSIYKKGINYG